MSQAFDLERAFAEANLDPNTKAKILQEVQSEFPDPGPLFELHVIRAIDEEICRRDGYQVWLERLRAKIQQLRQDCGMEVIADESGHLKLRGRPSRKASGN